MGGFFPIGGGGLGFETAASDSECAGVGRRLFLSAATEGGSVGVVADGGIGGAPPGLGGGAVGAMGGALGGAGAELFLCPCVSGSES